MTLGNLHGKHTDKAPNYTEAHRMHKHSAALSWLLSRVFSCANPIFACFFAAKSSLFAVFRVFSQTQRRPRFTVFSWFFVVFVENSCFSVVLLEMWRAHGFGCFRVFFSSFFVIFDGDFMKDLSEVAGIFFLCKLTKGNGARLTVYIEDTVFFRVKIHRENHEKAALKTCAPVERRLSGVRFWYRAQVKICTTNFA